jgi:hypothetical protein
MKQRSVAIITLTITIDITAVTTLNTQAPAAAPSSDHAPLLHLHDPGGQH